MRVGVFANSISSRRNSFETAMVSVLLDVLLQFLRFFVQKRHVASEKSLKARVGLPYPFLGKMR